jgi:hypothetical protein
MGAGFFTLPSTYISTLFRERNSQKIIFEKKKDGRLYL